MGLSYQTGLALYTPRGYTSTMNTAIGNRLKRIVGQLESLEREISTEHDCANVIPQFLAVKGAVNAAFLAYVTDALRACEKSDRETLEHLLTQLIKS